MIESGVVFSENTMPYACRAVYELQLNVESLSLWHADRCSVPGPGELCQESRQMLWCDIHLVLAQRHLWRENPLMPTAIGVAQSCRSQSREMWRDMSGNISPDSCLKSPLLSWRLTCVFELVVESNVTSMSYHESAAYFISSVKSRSCTQSRLMLRAFC